MGREWTEEQKQVISLRNRNILVSAAAGSGKTAVLVERILSKLTEPEHPVDIDRLLVMTFTRAAAGEMKERIAAALEEALYADPDNENLQKQNMLLHTAQITTIDGFCAWLLRNYFHLIDLDPGYRVADEGELKLLREDVLDAVLEDAYAQAETEFIATHPEERSGRPFQLVAFVECYSSGKTDDEIREIILQVYDAAMSNPYPEEWLEECISYYRIETAEELRESQTMQKLWRSVREEDLTEAERLTREALKVCREPGGPYLYEEALQADLQLIEELKILSDKKDYNGMRQTLENLSFTRLSAKKADGVEANLKELVKSQRDEVKKILKDLSDNLFGGTEEEILETIRRTRGAMEALIALTKSFWKAFSEKKREKNLLDFTDMEHFALQILVKRLPDGTREMTQAARELSERFDEVMVDEYQDSNLIQELLTTCVSGWTASRKNVFMVGDVKQSIYRFRLARPELFMEKYHSYTLEESDEQRIDLHKNFRSRPQVLDSINYIFRQIMGEDLGGIAYDDAAALYPGAVFPEGADPDFLTTEVMLVEKDSELLTDEAVTEDARELEALAIVHKIQEMVGTEKIADPKAGICRPVEYGDIVVLLRSASGWSETFTHVFEASGIPVYAASRTGYFSALEVVTVLNYLRVCDNPRQDIPLTGVLRSPMVGLDSQQLALLRSMYPKGLLYESVLAAIEDPEEPDEAWKTLKEKLRSFQTQLTQMRSLAEFTPIHELILKVLDETGYGNYARALPGGEQRSANLYMLVEKARDYENTSYRGLFNFIRYIEKLQKYEVDFGEVNLADAGCGAVRIMTIHKSKGLEFPIVFLAGMGKQFNFRDTNAKLLIHPQMGIGADAILPKERMLVKSLHKQMIRKEILRENLGEELRVLYVALTRAREKLIMTGTVGDLEKQMHVLGGYLDEPQQLLPLASRMKAKNYWSFVLPALARHRSMKKLFAEYGILGSASEEFSQASAEFSVTVISPADLVQDEIAGAVDREILEERMKNWDASRIYDEEIRGILKRRFDYVYPYGYLKEIPVKVSVSEMKKRSHMTEEEREASRYVEREFEPLYPRFAMEEEEAMTGAARGTAYHRVMECLDYTKVCTEEELKSQVDTLVKQEKLKSEEAASIQIRDLEVFAASPIGRRMKQAAETGNLYREQPFVISEQASLLDPSWNGDEQVLVQGIIDAYFLENDEIVLVDYKTDRVRSGEEQKLIDLYHVQLEDYARALERMLLRKVKEAYIYSFTLGKEIRLF